MLSESLALTPDGLVACLLLATRIGALLLMSPPIGGRAVPALVRLAVVFSLAACLASHVPVPQGGWSLAIIVTALFGELAIGAAMGLGLNLAVAAFGVGMRVVDTQVGFGIGQVVDPVTRRQTPILSGIFGQLAQVLLVCAGALEGVVRGLAASVQAVPPGTAWSVTRAAPALFHQVSALFALGFAIAAPAVLCLFLVDITLGVVSRTLPQMNMFTMGMPVKVLVGLLGLAAWLPFSLGLMLRTYSTVFQGWEALFR
jgi:flagellar biosynthetic protein FliR